MKTYTFILSDSGPEVRVSHTDGEDYILQAQFIKWGSEAHAHELLSVATSVLEDLFPQDPGFVLDHAQDFGLNHLKKIDVDTETTLTQAEIVRMLKTQRAEKATTKDHARAFLRDYDRILKERKAIKESFKQRDADLAEKEVAIFNELETYTRKNIPEDSAEILFEGAKLTLRMNAGKAVIVEGDLKEYFSPTSALIKKTETYKADAVQVLKALKQKREFPWATFEKPKQVFSIKITGGIPANLATAETMAEATAVPADQAAEPNPAPTATEAQKGTGFPDPDKTVEVFENQEEARERFDSINPNEETDDVLDDDGMVDADFEVVEADDDPELDPLSPEEEPF